MMTLSEFFVRHPRAAIAFSGGVDSAYLLSAAKAAGAQVCAYTVHSAFQPAFELADAQRLAAELAVPLRVLPVDILACGDVASNGPARCYHCKKQIFSAISQAALADGFSLLLDGTNASDQADDRPGMRALAEMRIRSPLRECGLTKDDVRRYSKEAGLFTWFKPAYACLATRVATGEPLTEAALRATERAEDYLFSLGFTDFRVRRSGTRAKIQVHAQQLSLLLSHREDILTALAPDYDEILLDLEVRP